MKVEKINSHEIYKDNNKGFVFGLQEVGDNINYIEWFKSEKAREEEIIKNKFEVID